MKHRSIDFDLEEAAPLEPPGVVGLHPVRDLQQPFDRGFGVGERPLLSEFHWVGTASARLM